MRARKRETFEAARSPLIISLVYIAAGALWIAFSSALARRVTYSPDALATLETLKGWGFVVVTGLIVYLLLRRREAALQRSEIARHERESLLEHVGSLGPVVIYRMEIRDGVPVPTWVSGSVERLLGYSPAETFAPGWWLDRLHPDDRAEAARFGAEIVEKGGLVQEYRLRTKHGDYRWIRDVVHVAHGPNGRDVLGAWLDVTKQRQAEEALREREAFYRSLIENASDTILLLDPGGAVLYASPSIERHTGYAAEDSVRGNAFDQIHPEDLPRMRTAFERALHHPPEVVAVEYRRRHADGSWRHVSSVGRRLPGEPARLVVNSRDITENRVVEEQFRRAQKFEAVGQLTAGIVHDFNNVLSVVLSNAELVLADLPPALTEQRNDLEHIKQAARSGADMVRKLLAFSRQADLAIAPLDLRSVVDGVAVMLRRLVPPSLRVRVDVQDAAPLVRADGGAVQQILLNLATNARDAMPDGGELTITVARVQIDDRYVDARPWVVPGEYVKVAVMDTGVGMDGATKARIFEPFFTTKPPGKGTGLGMAMVLGLVKQHGGHVDVDTEVGRGTTVCICLPVAPAGSAVQRRAEPVLLRGGTETIVLVEDEDVLRRTGKRILERFGYTVLAAEDGSRGLEVLAERAGQVDLILSDVQMPGLSGVQFYHEVRRRGWTVPFLFVSGEGARAFQEEYHLADAGFVQKPWTVEEVAGAVRAALDRRS